MAALSTRSRRNQGNASEDSETPVESVVDDSKVKSRNSNSRSARVPSVTVEHQIEVKSPPLISKEFESVSNAPANSTEEISSNTSESGSSNKSSSVTSDESLNKTKDELIKSAHDLDSQLKELIKMYRLICLFACSKQYW